VSSNDEQLIIVLQGPTSKNPLSYKWYNVGKVILGKKMKI
jgi:xylose isomerase